jgi:hypothetical protein
MSMRWKGWELPCVGLLEFCPTLHPTWQLDLQFCLLDRDVICSVSSALSNAGEEFRHSHRRGTQCTSACDAIMTKKRKGQNATTATTQLWETRCGTGSAWWLSRGKKKNLISDAAVFLACWGGDMVTSHAMVRERDLRFQYSHVSKHSECAWLFEAMWHHRRMENQIPTPFLLAKIILPVRWKIRGKLGYVMPSYMGLAPPYPYLYCGGIEWMCRLSARSSGQVGRDSI